MHNSYIYNLTQACKNRGVEFKNNGNGTVTLDGNTFDRIRDCDEYLESKNRLDLE